MRHLILPLVGAFLLSLTGCDAGSPSGTDASTPGAIDYAAPINGVTFSTTDSLPDYVLMHVYGDSQAAGKGDPTTSCDLRPDVGPKGYVYNVNSRAYLPVCDPAGDPQHSGSLVPALVDEFYNRTGVTPLVVIFTIKGSSLTPEAAPMPKPDMYWYVGDNVTPMGEAFRRAQRVFKRAEKDAQRQFRSATILNLGAVHSYGGADIKRSMSDSTLVASEHFTPRLQGYDDLLTQGVYPGFQAFYLELADNPNDSDFNAAAVPYQAEFESVLSQDRIIPYMDSVVVWHDATGLPYETTGWLADRQGHLGSLGLDYLGAKIADYFYLPSEGPPAFAKR